MTKVELFEQTRKAYFLNYQSIRGIAKHYKIHRRQVRQAISNPLPPERHSPQSARIVLTKAMMNTIDEWLLSDGKSPKKQRHTAQRIFTRLIEEHHFTGKLPTIKRHVGERRRLLGLKQEGFVPLAYTAGEEAEVDWYEAYVDFPWGQREKVYFFQMRACFSGRSFHMAFPRCTAQAFLEGHVKAFEYFGGVFKKMRYDNLTSAVTKVLKGRARIESERFTLLRSHYLFDAIFCQPGIKGAHEKGGVENGVGRFRRQHLVPVPAFKDFDDLNDYVLACCRKDDQRQMTGKPSTILDDWKKEQSALLPLPKTAFDYTEVHSCRVNSRSLITLKTNGYSVPVRLIGQTITVRLSSHRLSCYYQGQCIATHDKCRKTYEIKTQLDHYLELLWKKPGAVPNALPLIQAKKQCSWDPVYEQFWQHLIDRNGTYEGTRQWIDILLLLRRFDSHTLCQAIQQSIESSCYSVASVQQYLSPQCPNPKDLFQTNRHLAGYHQPPSQTHQYDCLLSIQGEKHHDNISQHSATTT